MPTDDERIEELVDYLVESMDTDALEHFVRENLTEYYSNDGGRDDLETNYAEMKEMMGCEACIAEKRRR